MKTWQNLTHMINDTDCIAEMKKKFQGTVMGINVPGNDQTTYAYYTGINNLEQHVFNTREEDKITLAPNTTAEVFIPNPKVGLYNTPNNGVVSFTRLPYRQHRRGLYRDTATIENYLTRLTLWGMHTTPNLFDTHIYDVLNDKLQKETTLEEALHIAEKNISHALNRKFYVCVSHNQKTGFSIFYHHCYIGNINEKEKTITIFNDLFVQELVDYLKTEPHQWKLL